VKAVARALLLALLGIAWTAPARAQSTCGSPERPWVSLTFAEANWPLGFASRVLGDLRAGLTSRGIDACPDETGPNNEPPLATVRIAALEKKSVVLTVEIRDAVTAKRVSRDIDLAAVPADGRAFAIAIAIDELVWASWAEVALARKSRKQTTSAPRPAPPPEVVKGVESELPSSGPASKLGVRFAMEHYLGGQTLLGADAATILPLGERFALDLDAGGRVGLDADAPHGDVHSSSIGFGASGRFAFVHTSFADVGVALGVRAAVVRFRGTAAPGAQGEELSGLTVYGRGGAFTGLRLAGPVSLDAGFGAGAPFRALEATDAGQVVSGVSGAEFYAQLGFTVEL
jgi:hypothetical protein